jgi:outer membrane protein assembly factor BamB
VKRFVGEGTEKARLEAEDLVIAIDAKTGKTVWKAVEPGGFVWGVGKRHGFQVAPAYYQGRVFSMGTTGRLFSYEAATGKRLWQTPADPRMEEERRKWLADPRGALALANYGWQQSLTVVGGALIVPGNSRLVGRDIDSGEIKWQLDRVISSWATPNVWRNAGREYLLAATVAAPGKAELRLIDPQQGRVLWTVDGLHATHFTLAPSENHVLVNVGSTITAEGNASAPKDEQGNAYYGRLGCYRISPEGAKLIWSFPDQPHYVHSTWFDVAAMRRVLVRNGLVYYASCGPDKEADRRIVIAREQTGQILADQPLPGGSYMHLIENRLLHAIDWAHGSRATFDWYPADPADFQKLSGPWTSEHPLTTAYTVNLEVPVVAGRMFLRTETGTILCYDLRETVK